MGALRFPPARWGRGERVLWDEGDKGDGEWGWKFLNGDANGPDAGTALTGEIDTVEDERDELDEPDGTGSIEGFDFGFTMGDIEGFRRAPSSHLFFSSSSARLSPCQRQLAFSMTTREEISSPLDGDVPRQVAGSLPRMLVVRHRDRYAVSRDRHLHQ